MIFKMYKVFYSCLETLLLHPTASTAFSKSDRECTDGSRIFYEKKNWRQKYMICCPQNDSRSTNVKDQWYTSNICLWIPCYSLRNHTFGIQWGLPVSQKHLSGSAWNEHYAPSEKDNFPCHVLELSPFPWTVDDNFHDYGDV
jgi:hypothetical protein